MGAQGSLFAEITSIPVMFRLPDWFFWCCNVSEGSNYTLELTPSCQSYQSCAVEVSSTRNTIPEEISRTEGLPESSHTIELTSSIQSHESYVVEISPRHQPVHENIAEFSPKRSFNNPSTPVTAEDTEETDNLSGSVSECAEYDSVSDAVAEGEYSIRIGRKTPHPQWRHAQKTLLSK